MISPRRIIVFLTFFLGCLRLSAQNGQADTDSLVRLMSAQSVHIVETEGGKYREVIGPARFLHNNTYLVCDTAIWHVDEAVINAYGNVQILQDETVLSSDKLDYYVDEDRAEFRGGVVQLQDKQNNTLRTRHLDYNTKDSVAVFRNGGSLKDKDGQIMESNEGTYDSKTKIFDFVWNVNMFVDSVFVKADHLRYYGDSDIAEFDTQIFAWQDDKMLSANFGRYDRSTEEYFFRNYVHAMSEDQEVWADSLYFYRVPNNVELRGNVQLVDTTRNAMAVADYLQYVDSVSTVVLEKNAAIAAITDREGQVDTLYLGSDRIVYKGIRKCDIPESEIQASVKRLNDLAVDPVAEYRSKNAAQSDSGGFDEAQATIGTDAAPEENTVPEEDTVPETDTDPEAEAAPDEDTVPEADTVMDDGSTVQEEDVTPEEDAGETAPEEDGGPEEDAGGAAPEEPEETEPKDTARVALITAVGNVRAFRPDVQARCDSLEFFQLDSLARLYVSPVIWNEEGVHQYSADSITLKIASNSLEQASLMSEAFVTIKEEENCYDQIKGTEMMAYFDTTANLRRFDALGGASAIFFLKENDAFATVNKVECRMLSANLSGGELERIYYFDNPKNNAYPVVRLTSEERQLKGFNWRGDERPKSRRDVTELEFRDTERERFNRIQRGHYRQTEIYFPGYMKDVYDHIAERDSIRAVREQMHAMEQEELERLDSLANAPVDSLFMDVNPVADTLEVEAEEQELVREEGITPIPEDATEIDVAELLDALEPQETPADQPAEQLSRDEERAAKRAEADAARAERLKAREARWAELDARDAARAAAKEEKAAQRARARKLRMIKAQEKRAAKEQKILDRYIKYYEKQKERLAGEQVIEQTAE